MGSLLKGVNLYLVGMMGSGKTTVGRLLAVQLGYRFVDTDEAIAQLAGKSITDIFASDGEDSFRQIESQVLAEVSAYKNSIVATGGGIVLRPYNWSHLHHGIVLWLDVPVEKLCDRLQCDTSRPLLKNTDPFAKLQTIHTQRQPFYAQADVRVTVTDETPEQVAARAIEEIRKVLRPEVANAAETN